MCNFVHFHYCLWWLSLGLFYPETKIYVYEINLYFEWAFKIIKIIIFEFKRSKWNVKIYSIKTENLKIKINNCKQTKIKLRRLKNLEL